MSIKLLLYLVALLLFAVASIYAGIRSRLRVRALIEEDVKPAAPCTIPREGVRRFLVETRVLRQLLDGLVDDVSPGIRSELDEDPEALLALGNYARALSAWVLVYERELDDEDRDALALRGVAASSVLSLCPRPDDTAPGPSLREMRRQALELDRIEAAMTDAPRLAAYR